MKTHQAVAKIPDASAKKNGQNKDGRLSGLQRRQAVTADAAGADATVSAAQNLALAYSLASIPVQCAGITDKPQYPEHAFFEPPANTEVFDDSGTKLASVQESNGLQAVVAPHHYNTGSEPTEGVRTISKNLDKVFPATGHWVAGHMLNEHLGGPGNDQKNITALSTAANHMHETSIERLAKKLVEDGNTILYWTRITERETFRNPRSNAKVSNLASKLQGGYQVLGGPALEGQEASPMDDGEPIKAYAAPAKAQASKVKDERKQEVSPMDDGENPVRPRSERAQRMKEVRDRNAAAEAAAAKAAAESEKKKNAQEYQTSFSLKLKFPANMKSQARESKRK